MRIACVGGGPGGLYLALLMKRADARHEILVIERNGPDDTFGFGVVFSDATMAGIAAADADAFDAIGRHLVHWDDIAVYFDGTTTRSTGHGFSGMSRRTLLNVLQQHVSAAGVKIEFHRELASLDELADFDLVVGADGVNSTVRGLLRENVDVDVDVRPNRFVWLGTSKPFAEFTFYFRHDEHGLWRVHAYQYAADRSTFIVECRDDTWRAAGLHHADESTTIAFLERLFANELDGHRLIANRSLWRQFPTIRVSPWSVGHVVLVGDAAHTAHFSVGSGTRMAMEDAVALRDALVACGDCGDIAAALDAYERARRPAVESLQRAAQASLRWFEDTERYMRLHPLQMTFTLLTRSLRITH
jgi:anthraniloyl-CoA monooxygenase